jgi:hypothetical protein
MRTSRRSVTAALWTLLDAAYPWAFADQRAQVPDDVMNFAQPAMFLTKVKESVVQSDRNFALTSYVLHYAVIIFVKASGAVDAPTDTTEMLIDDIIDAIDAALSSPRIGEPQTLGSIVSNAWIEGEVLIDPPVLFEQAAIFIPISVKVGV